MEFNIIGIDDNREQYFPPNIEAIIKDNSVFSGGARHYEIMKPYLPQNHSWIYITVPLSEVFAQYRKHKGVVVFASGDPLFFGFGNTILREMPEADVSVYPYFNSLQLLAHRLLMPYQNMHIVSLTGRPWDKFDEALILGYEKIGLLTDNKLHTPALIAARMLDYGYDNYTMTVGELLGNSEQERVSTWQLDEIATQKFAFPNNIILQRTHIRQRPFGIPENEFHLLNGRAKMITKMPIRLLSLNMLDMRDRSVFWDVGFCTGSVSVEAKLQFPHLKVVSFEKRTEGSQLMLDNARLFGTPSIEAVIGDFTETDISSYPTPDAVFIGGHGGKMDKIVAKIASVLSANGVIVFNSVSDESRKMFLDAIDDNDLILEKSIRVQVDEFNSIDVMKAVRK